jgi:hypothetical protein
MKICPLCQEKYADTETDFCALDARSSGKHRSFSEYTSAMDNYRARFAR